MKTNKQTNIWLIDHTDDIVCVTIKYKRKFNRQTCLFWFLIDLEMIWILQYIEHWSTLPHIHPLAIYKVQVLLSFSFSFIFDITNMYYLCVFFTFCYTVVFFSEKKVWKMTVFFLWKIFNIRRTNIAETTISNSDSIFSSSLQNMTFFLICGAKNHSSKFKNEYENFSITNCNRKQYTNFKLFQKTKKLIIIYLRNLYWKK